LPRRFYQIARDAIPTIPLPDAAVGANFRLASDLFTARTAKDFKTVPPFCLGNSAFWAEFRLFPDYCPAAWAINLINAFLLYVAHNISPFLWYCNQHTRASLLIAAGYPPVIIQA
jgi:hypothetical protein